MLETSKHLLLTKGQELSKKILALWERLPFAQETLFKSGILLFIGTLSLYVVFQTVALFLPLSGVHYYDKSTFIPRHLYKLGDAFYESSSAAAPVTGTTQTNYTPLTAWSIQAMFSEDDFGFIVVLINNKSHYINIGESRDGYKLIKIIDKQAILLRDGKEYALSLALIDKTLDESKTPLATEKVELDVARLKEGIVTRQDINTFMNDPKLIWDNIKIRPQKEDNKIKGFLVRYVKKGSVFDHLGLRAGDIILSANGVAFTSIKQAQELYANIDAIDNISITVLRQSKMKELTYEIQ